MVGEMKILQVVKKNSIKLSKYRRMSINPQWTSCGLGKEESGSEYLVSRGSFFLRVTEI